MADRVLFWTEIKQIKIKISQDVNQGGLENKIDIWLLLYMNWWTQKSETTDIFVLYWISNWKYQHQWTPGIKLLYHGNE